MTDPVPQPGGRAAPSHEEPPSTARATHSIVKSWRLWAGVGALIFVIGGSGAVGYTLGHSAAESDQAAADAAAAAASAAAADSRLSDAYGTCVSRDEDNTVELGDGGDSIIIDTRSKYTSVAGVACVLNDLGTPESIVSSIDHTTAMMGSRDAEHDGLTYTWSYHPDNGVNLVITNED
ncbi:hypothetical protein ACI78Q_05095 [Geodermatophilus sp. SYSU D00705]